MSKHDRILLILSEIKESFVSAEVVFTQGSCFKLYKILKAIFPEAVGYSNGGHVVTKIDGKFYDINGDTEIDLSDPDENWCPKWYIVDDESDEAQWGFNMYDIEIECPNCEELFFKAELEPINLAQTRERYEHNS